MYRVKTLGNITEEGLSRLGQGYEYDDDIQNPERTLVRSTAIYGLELPSELLAIVRAGAGVNNIPIDRCSECGIMVFSTPGASVNAVEGLVIVELFLAPRKIASTLGWTKTLKGKGSDASKLVERGKNQFAGPETKGKSLGVIGFDAIGILVANTARNLGMEVYGYDSYLSVDTAWGLSRWIHHVRTLDEIFENCDYLIVYVPPMPDTKGLINVGSIVKMRDKARILNFARGELIDTTSVLDDLKSSKIAAYATDLPPDELIGVGNVLAVPHLGASTPESKENYARMVADELKKFLENGNIRNFVNMPSISMPRAHAVRICVFHHNVRSTVSRFSGIMVNAGINTEDMQSRSRGDYTYTILDVTDEVGDAALELMRQTEETTRLCVTR